MPRCPPPCPEPPPDPRPRFPLRLPGSSTATAPLPGSRFPGAPLTPRSTHLGPGAVLHAAAGLHGERGRLRPPWRGAPRAAGPGPGPGPNPSPSPGPGSSSRHRPAGAGSRKGPPGARLRGAAAGSLHEGSLHGSRARPAQPLAGVTAAVLPRNLPSETTLTATPHGFPPQGRAHPLQTLTLGTLEGCQSQMFPEGCSLPGCGT